MSFSGDGLLSLFQFTPLREGRRYRAWMGEEALEISIHAPPRGATIAWCNEIQQLHFNSRPSARGDGIRSRSRCAYRYISIHAPPRGATRVRTFVLVAGNISIHAPPRGATVPTKRQRYRKIISIHAPPRGATVRGAESCQTSAFQFTPLREGRLVALQGAVQRERISIHAPPRGATGEGMDSGDKASISIHAPPRGATSGGLLVYVGFCISIHAPPRGATRRSHPKRAAGGHFNSRPSARGDPDGWRIARRNRRVISIHAPPRGATTPALLSTGIQFQFTPLREGRRTLDGAGFCVDTHFNSRPSARGDGKRYAISANLLFNPYKSAWLNNSATQFVEIILVIFHRIIA